MNAPTASAPSLFRAPRVQPNAAHAFGGIWRLTFSRFFTVNHWLVLGGMLAVLALLAFGASASSRSVAQYVNWASHFYVCFLVPVLGFISAGGLLRDDLRPGSVDYVFTRPVRRPLFLLFRYVSHVLCAQINFVFALGVVAAVGLFRGSPDVLSALPCLFLAQFVLLFVFSAFGFLCAMLTSRYVIIGLLYGALIEVGLGNVPTQLSRISMIRHGREILQPVLGVERIGMGGPLAVDPLSPVAAIGLLCALTAGMLAVTVLLFSFKELAGAAKADV